MKNSILFFLFSLFLFSSCETDFELNSDWEDVTIVFGLLDQSQDKQYIRINKAFLGEEDALYMASISDSLNYNPQDLEVKIQRVNYTSNNTYNVLAERILTDTIMEKENGLFATDENIVYFFDTDNFLIEDKTYILVITNLKTGKKITAETDLIHSLTLMSAFNNPSYKMGFYNNFLGYTSTTIEWIHSKNAHIYQMSMEINYEEYLTNNDTVSKTITKIFPIIEYQGNSEMQQVIDGQEFFNFLKNKIPSNSEENVISRRIIDIDLLFSVSTQELETYINLNTPPTGIVQQRPVYTNVDNGFGLFTSRYNKIQSGLELTSTTYQYINDSLSSLHFVHP